MSQITLGILKPTVAACKWSVDAVLQTIAHESRLEVVASKTMWMDPDLAGRFYAEHQGKFYFERLVKHATSGPCHFLVLQGPDAIASWRLLIGPTHVYKDVWLRPESLRARFGLSDTRNSFHGSDSPESVKREMGLFFDASELKRIH